MTLRRKIDDVLGFYKSAIVEHEHLARNDFLALASRFVGFVVRRPLPPELQGNAFAHHSNGIHSIDDRIDTLLEQVALGDPEPRKAFFEAYKDIENLWEILSPAKELVDHIATFKRLAQLYATVRNAYAEKIGFVADLAYKNPATCRAKYSSGGRWPVNEEHHL